MLQIKEEVLMKNRIVLFCLIIGIILFSFGCKREDAELLLGKGISSLIASTKDEVVEEMSVAIMINPLEGLINVEDVFDYNDYLNKIWIPQEWGEESVSPRRGEGISFIITDIKNGRIEGKITPGYVADPSNERIRFWGTIQNGIGYCKMVDEQGGISDFTIMFQNGEIQTKFTVVSTRMSEFANVAIKERYQTYNLEDINQEITINDSKEINTNMYGEADVVVGKRDSSRRVVGEAYLTTAEGDILYEFKAPFRHGTEIIEVYVEDINDDGLSDVIMIEKFDVSDEYLAEWTFIQLENGLFEQMEITAY